ncbi:MAG: alpha/beta fold hydrolase [Dehalococcoidia bacterium]
MPKAKVNGIDLAYEVYGEGPPLVLAHGYIASKEMWDYQIGPFSEKHRVVVYDMRGHGESEAPPEDDAGYAMDTLVEDQRALMGHLGIEQAYLGGLSMGGSIAMRFALKYPQRVRALLLFDTAAGHTQAGQEMRRQWQTNHDLISTFIRSTGVADTLRNLYAQRVQTPGAGTAEAPAEVHAFMERMQHLSPDGFLGAGRALWEQDDVLDRMPEIAAPTLVLVGEMDFLLDASKRMHEKLSGARFCLIKSSGHGTAMWQPEKFTSAVLDFLTDVEAGRPVAGSEER